MLTHIKRSARIRFTIVIDLDCRIPQSISALSKVQIEAVVLLTYVRLIRNQAVKVYLKIQRQLLHTPAPESITPASLGNPPNPIFNDESGRHVIPHRGTSRSHHLDWAGGVVCVAYVDMCFGCSGSLTAPVFSPVTLSSTVEKNWICGSVECVDVRFIGDLN